METFLGFGHFLSTAKTAAGSVAPTEHLWIIPYIIYIA